MDSLRGCHMIDHTTPSPRIHVYCASRYASDASELTPEIFPLLLNNSSGTRFSASLVSELECVTFENITSTFAHGLPVEYELLLRYLQRQPR